MVGELMTVYFRDELEEFDDDYEMYFKNA